MSNIKYLAEKLHKTEEETQEWLTNLVKNTSIPVDEMAETLLKGIQYQESQAAKPNLSILAAPNYLEQQQYVIEPPSFHDFTSAKMMKRRKKKKRK